MSQPAGKMLIIGAGYTGMRLATRARELGWEVVGTSRSPETLAALEAIGAKGLTLELLGEGFEALAAHLGPEVDVIYSAPTLFTQHEPELPHLKPMRSLLSLLRRQGARRLIYLSSTSVYGDHHGAWVDEQTVVKPVSALGMMRRELELEAMSAAAHFPVNVARIVGIYGPGRTLLDYLTKGRYTLVDGGYKRTNRVHVDDLVEAILAMCARAPRQGSRIFNVADGRPLMVRELVSFLVERLGIDWPREEALEDYARRAGPNAAARWESEYLCRNLRLSQELGVVPRYPTAIDGYEAMIAQGQLGAVEA